MILALQIIIVAAAVILGARLGSIGIGLAGGLYVLLLGLTGIEFAFADIPFDVIGIIMSVVAAIAAMQRAGRLDWLVVLAEKLLRRNPRYVTYLAPVVTYTMTLPAGTGHTAFSTLPLIAEVAKERPSRPLSVAVVASQMAITASPISAAVVFFASILEPHGIGYLQLLAVVIPSTFLAVFPTAFVANRLAVDPDKDPTYRERLEKGLIKAPEARAAKEAPPRRNAPCGSF